MSKTRNRINVVGMFIVGLALIALGITLHQKAVQFEKNTIIAQGTVVDFKISKEGLAAPIVNFTDSKGNEHQFTSKSSSNPPKYYIGDDVIVNYVPMIVGVEANIYSESHVFIKKVRRYNIRGVFVLLSIIMGLIFWNRDSQHVYVEKTIDIR